MLGSRLCVAYSVSVVCFHVLPYKCINGNKVLDFLVSGEIEQHCMVMSGEWVCGNGEKWDFVVDKNQMARLVAIHDEICLRELEESVLREFGVEGFRFTAALSYWPPTTSELATGIKTPPVLMTNDEAIKFFLQHMRAKGCMSLFVRFVRKTKEEEAIDDSGMGFVTPGSFRLNACSRTSSGSVRRGSAMDVGSGSFRAFNVSRLGQKAPVVNLEDVEFVREVERAEEELMGGSASRKEEDLSSSGKGEAFSGSRKEEALSGFSSGEEEVGNQVHEVDERDVRPRGYDEDFWAPLLAGDYGGSNVVNLLYNEDEIVADIIRKTGPYSKALSPNMEQPEIGFDVGGPSCVKKDEIVETNPWMSGNNPTPNVVRPGPASTRKLEEVDDEEFDIPPLFDDTSYETAAIPDMDLVPSDGRIYVGKVYGSKQDCQISLAIYAIRNQFRYTQTRTKIDSFVVECPDPKCDWRVMAREIKGGGFYEIRKAQLDHRCPIDFRQGYKSRATSRVIASVYKSKFGEVGKGPVPRELQKLVLEDLRVNVSYMK